MYGWSKFKNDVLEGPIGATVFIVANALWVYAMLFHNGTEWVTCLSLTVWGLNAIFILVELFVNQGQPECIPFVLLLDIPFTLWFAGCTIKALFQP